MYKAIKQSRRFALTLSFLMIMASGIFSQTAPPSPTAPLPAPPRRTVVQIPPQVREFPAQPILPGDRQTSEKLLMVDGRVNVSMCVLEGNVKINGWERSEIRVFVKNGSRIGFKILQKNKQNTSPEWIMVLGFDSVRSQPSECFYGEEIEIDAPRGASVSVKGQETKITIDSVRKASVKNIGGDVALQNIAAGVEAATYEGDVTVESSGGAMNLESANGNIVAFEVAPSEIGDIFRAKTNNGTIALQGLEHRQIEINSISGAVVFNGALLSGGSYTFGTSNGAINLAIPADSSCKVTASYGFGGFTSEIPIDILTENKHPRVQNIIGTMGDGDATLNLTTANGAIRIKSKKAQ